MVFEAAISNPLLFVKPLGNYGSLGFAAGTPLYILLQARSEIVSSNKTREGFATSLGSTSKNLGGGA